MFNKCSDDKLCLMTAPPVGWEKQNEAYTCKKQSMITFSSISHNKNNSSYNSIDQNLTLELCSPDIYQVVNNSDLL